MRSLSLIASSLIVAGSLLVAAPASAAPASPRNVTAVGDIEQISLFWDAPAASAVTGYAVSCQGAGGSGATSYVSAVTPSSARSYVFKGLAAGTAYECRVAARDATGESPASVAPSITVVGAPQPPTLTAATPVDGGLSVTLTAPSNTGGLPILDYRVTCGGFTVITSTTQATVPQPGEYSTVSCKAKARNALAVSDDSNGISALPGQRPKDAKVSRVSAAEAGKLTVAVSASTTPSAPVLLYKVTCQGARGGAPATGSASVSPVTVVGVGGGSYTCSVVAENSFGASLPSLPSSPVSAVPVLEPLAAPVVSMARRSEKGAIVQVSFTRVNGAREYAVACSRGSATVDEDTSDNVVELEVAPGVWGCTVSYELERFTSPISAVTTVSVTPDAPRLTAGKRSLTAVRPAGLSSWSIVCTNTKTMKSTTKRGSSSSVAWTNMAAGTYSCVASGNGVSSAPVTAVVSA